MGGMSKVVSKSRFIDVDSHTGLHTPKLSEPIIDDVLRKGHILMLTGPPKAGKSWCLEGLGYSIANGSRWLGFKCHKGKVAFIDTELDRNSLFNRFDKVREAMKLEDSCGNLKAWSLRGESIDAEKLVSEIKKAFEGDMPSMVIIDSIYSIESGDENSAGDMRKLMIELGNLASSGCSVAFAHHHAKGAAGARNVIDRGSGSGVFGRYVDAMLDLTPIVLDKDSEPTFAEQFKHNERAVPLRLNFVLREFADPGAMDVAFDFPLLVAANGISTSPEEGTPRANAIKGAKSAHQGTGDNRSARDDAIKHAVELCNQMNIQPTKENVYERLIAAELPGGKIPTQTTFNNWLTPSNETTKWHNDHGIVTIES